MTATIDSGAGLQSDMSVNSLPVISGGGFGSQPHIWAWIWFGVAVLVIIGFHVRVFGQAVPPAARFP